MVQIRKPVVRSEHIIDRRPRPGSARYAAKKDAEKLLAEALAQALKMQRRRPR